MEQEKNGEGPEVVKLFGPLLNALRELGGSAKTRAAQELVAKNLRVPPEVLAVKLEGGQGKFYNQVAFARQHLVTSGYIDGSKRGVWTLTEKRRGAHLTKDQSVAIYNNSQTGLKVVIAGPLIRALQQLGGSGKPREVSDQIAQDLNLPPTVIDATLPDGTPRFHNSVAWSRDYLVRKGLVAPSDPSSRGTWVLTERGWAEKPIIENARETIIRAFQGEAEATGAEPQYPLLDIPATPAAESLPSEFGPEEPQSLLQVLKGLSPKGFEHLCALLLRVSGFDNVEVTGRSHDGGFDGKGRLRVNPFVSMIVNFQCKRYARTVSREEVGDFRNSLLGRAEKGIFLTTGTFSAEAKKEAERVDPKIELVDGERLVEMLQDLKLGVKERRVFDVDYPFFEQYQV